MIERPQLEYIHKTVVTTKVVRRVTPESNRTVQLWQAEQARMNRLHITALEMNRLFDDRPLPKDPWQAYRSSHYPANFDRLEYKLRNRVDRRVWAEKGREYRARLYPELTDLQLKAAYRQLDAWQLPISFAEARLLAAWIKANPSTQGDAQAAFRRAIYLHERRRI